MPALSAIGTTDAVASDDASLTKPLGQLIHEGIMAHAFTPSHPLPAIEVVNPFESARDELTARDWHGRTVIEWVGVADAQRWLDMRATSAGSPDLVAEVARLASIAGEPLDVTHLASLRADALALPADVRFALADVVATVADAYGAQADVARAVAAQWPTEWNEQSRALTIEQREGTQARAESIMASLRSFADVARATQVAVPTFADPFGLVVLGGSGDDIHYASGALRDPIVLVDVGGNDQYENSAGGACAEATGVVAACNGLAISVALDVAGNDEYRYAGEPSVVQGAATMGGLGMLVDLDGDDRYTSVMIRGAFGPFYSYVDGGAQGFGQAGYGLLLDAAGDDYYRADVGSWQGRSVWDFAQGFGSLGGVGIAVDASGNDQWYAHGMGLGRDCCGFQGIYNNGVGFYGGVGINADLGEGDDTYGAWNNATTPDYYAQGFGAFGGLGILYEDGGNDDYTAVQIATDPFINPLLNCAFGTGSLGGAGVMLEMGGNDRYFGDNVSPRRAQTMNEGFGGIGAGYGMLIDVSGDDGHFMEAHGAQGSKTAGRGVLIENGSPLSGINTNGDGAANRFGNYLDLGGADAYTGAPPSADGASWSGGADVNGGGVTLMGIFGWTP